MIGRGLACASCAEPAGCRRRLAAEAFSGPMRHARPQRVRRRVHAVMILSFTVPVLVACLLFAFYSHRRARAADLAFAKLFDALAEGVAGLAPAGDAEALGAWIRQQAALPQVALLAVYDEQDRPLAVACLDAAKRQALADLWRRRPGEASGGARLELPDRGEVEVSYLSRRLTSRSARPGYLGLLVVRAADLGLMAPGPAEAWRAFYGPVAGLGLVGLLVALVWADRGVLKPLARFLDVGRRALTLPQEEAPQAKPETLGRLVEAVESLPAENQRWREEAKRLSRTVDRRVDAMTRHITRELRSAFKKAATDPLTGLGNRRVLDENLGALISQSLDANADLSMVLIDLDRFKDLNDAYGHQVGDDALRFVGGLLSGCLREDDIAVRLGGDEFVLLLPGVGSTEARNIVQRLIALFRQRCSCYDVSPSLSMSAGVVSLMDHPTREATEFMERADRALYAAKEDGRGRVKICSASMMPRTTGW